MKFRNIITNSVFFILILFSINESAFAMRGLEKSRHMLRSPLWQTIQTRFHVNPVDVQNTPTLNVDK